MSDLQLLFSYLSYYPDLMRATSDDASPTPGYLLHRIAELTRAGDSQTAKLVDFLIDRLRNTASPTIKLKTLRVMLYCARHGSSEFRRLLRMRDGDVSAGAAAAGEPDRVLGMTPYLWVRSTAQELLALLFSTADDVTVTQPRQLPGLGSASPSQGPYQGFGVSSRPDGGLSARVRHLVEDALSPGPAPDPAAGLDTDRGQYEPPPRLSAVVSGPETPGPLRILPRLPAPPPPTRGHIPGRAGGGWDDSDDDSDTVSVGSDIAAAIQPEDLATRLFASPEARDIREFCEPERGLLRSIVAAIDLANRLAPSDDVILTLREQLTSSNDVTRQRALVLLDCALRVWPAASGAALADAVATLTDAESEEVRLKAMKLEKIMERLSVAD